MKKFKKIMWIFGSCGYGKTVFVNSIIKDFQEKGKKTCKLQGVDFIDILVKSLKIKTLTTIGNIIKYSKYYDLFVLDHVDVSLAGKKDTQILLEKVIESITRDKKTKVILISQKKPEEIKYINFRDNSCKYVQIKSPSKRLKVKLIKEWLGKKEIKMSRQEIKEISASSNNLFELKGLFNRASFIGKHDKRKTKIH